MGIGIVTYRLRCVAKIREIRQKSWIRHSRVPFQVKKFMTAEHSQFPVIWSATCFLKMISSTKTFDLKINLALRCGNLIKKQRKVKKEFPLFKTAVFISEKVKFINQGLYFVRRNISATGLCGHAHSRYNCRHSLYAHV